MCQVKAHSNLPLPIILFFPLSRQQQLVAELSSCHCQDLQFFVNVVSLTIPAPTEKCSDPASLLMLALQQTAII